MMKYLNILAGAFSLMALAACSNNDEVTVEQPKGSHTITVAYNRGADTRFDITPKSTDGNPLSLSKYLEDGIKGSWKGGDQIALIDAEGTKYIYEATNVPEEGAAVATFTLVSDTPPTAEGDYKVVFPVEWDGSLSEFASQDVYNYEKFDINKYIYALGTAKLSGSAFGETTLTPIFSFLYIPENIKIINMEILTWDDAKDGKLNIPVYLQGDNLFNKIENYEGVSDDDLNKGSIKLSNFTFYSTTEVVKNDGDEEPVEKTVWLSDHDRFIAFPVFEGKSISELNFKIGYDRCYVLTLTSEDNYSYATFPQGGRIYVLKEDGRNLQFLLM